MVVRASESLKRQQELLHTILFTIRDTRRLKARQVAARMNMKIRTYYNFEAGKGPLDIAVIWSFAEATDSDPVAIGISLSQGDVDYALRCMDNKAAAILLAAFLQFNEKVGDKMTHLAAASLIEAFNRQFASLEDVLNKRDQNTERWLEENLPRI
ncbi:MAG: helix-turn-helix transcriptional regulator, partial [Caulobacter sp.]